MSAGILVLPGDGIGPEITPCAVAVLEQASRIWSLGLEFDTHEVGLRLLAEAGTTLSPATLAQIPEADGVILGPVSTFEYPERSAGGVNVSAELRSRFELFANIRPCRSRAGLAVVDPMDLVIVRENTEGFYADRSMYAGSGEFMPDERTAMAVRKITAEACDRIAHRAFEMARSRRRRVTAVHKANVLRMSDGLFLQRMRIVAEDYPEVELDDLIVDAAAALLVRDPERFDVIVTTNLFGDILSDEASELSGGLGLAASINAGDDICVAQAVHGSAPDIAGQDRANPAALILSAAMMLDWIAQRRGDAAFADAAAGITEVVDRTLADPAGRTRDLGGSLSTTAFTDLILAGITD